MFLQDPQQQTDCCPSRRDSQNPRKQYYTKGDTLKKMILLQNQSNRLEKGEKICMSILLELVKEKGSVWTTIFIRVKKAKKKEAMHPSGSLYSFILLAAKFPKNRVKSVFFLEPVHTFFPLSENAEVPT